MICIANYRDYRKIDRYRHVQEATNKPLLIAATRRTTAFIELDLPTGMQFTDSEQQIIHALLAEHRTRGRFNVSSCYAYCQSLDMRALELVLARLSRLLNAKTREVME